MISIRRPDRMEAGSPRDRDGKHALGRNVLVSLSHREFAALGRTCEKNRI